MRAREAEFHCLSRQPDSKNSKMASVTSGPIISHVDMKNSEEYPSGPPVLFLGREKKASFISARVNFFSNSAVCSSEHLKLKRRSRSL